MTEDSPSGRVSKNPLIRETAKDLLSSTEIQAFDVSTLCTSETMSTDLDQSSLLLLAVKQWDKIARSSAAQRSACSGDSGLSSRISSQVRAPRYRPPSPPPEADRNDLTEERTASQHGSSISRHRRTRCEVAARERWPPELTNALADPPGPREDSRKSRREERREGSQKSRESFGIGIAGGGFFFISIQWHLRESV